ncbi:MAG: G8 domain-containing protein [Planctomycetota bacterium]|jgi:hypothetical protein
MNGIRPLVIAGVAWGLLLAAIAFTPLYVMATPDNPGNPIHAETKEQLAERKDRERIAVLSLVAEKNVTHRTVKSGMWSDPGTWKYGKLPAEKSRVQVMPGHVVTVDEAVDVPLMTVRVDGELTFDPSRTTGLVFDTLVVTEEGRLQIGTERGPIGDTNGDGVADNPSVRAQLIVNDLNGGIDHDNARSPDYDPYHLGQGVIVLGSVQMRGGAKDGYATVSEIPAGVTRLTLDQAPRGWQVGDLIALPGYRIDGTGDELRQITAIDGRSLEFAAVEKPDGVVSGRAFSRSDETAAARAPRRTLEEVSGQRFDEKELTLLSRWNEWPYESWRRDAQGKLEPDFKSPRQRVQFKLHIINITRNISIETAFGKRDDVVVYEGKGKGFARSARRKTDSEDISESTGRGCFILLHHNRGDIRYVSLAGLGRSDDHNIHRFPAFKDGKLIEPAYNPFGRDALTVYWADNETPKATVYGCAVYDAVGYGICNNQSNVHIESCVAYHIGVVGFVFLQYDAVGAMIDNVAMRCVGGKDGKTGYAVGHGFMSEGTHARIEDNVAAGFTAAAFEFDGQKGMHETNKRPIPFDPEISVDDAHDSKTIRKCWSARRFRNNTAYGGQLMINTQRWPGNYLGTQLMLNWFGHGLLHGMGRLYAGGNCYLNTLLFAHPDHWGEGIGFGRHSNSGAQQYVNCQVFGFDIGCTLSSQGFEQVVGGRWQNVLSICTEWRPKRRKWPVNFVIHEPEFIPFPKAVQPEKKRAEISCHRASVYNDAPHGYPLVCEFTYKGRTHQLYPARETHPDYVDLLKISNQKGYDTIRYGDPATIKELGADLKREYGLDGPWFCSVKPPEDALYPENRTVGLKERPSGKGNTWRRYLILQDQLGITFQNTAIQADVRPTLQTKTFRKRNISVNGGRPLTFEDLTLVPAERSASGTDEYQFLIDCSDMLYSLVEPRVKDGYVVLASEFRVPESEMPEDLMKMGRKARGRVMNELREKHLFVKSAEFVKDRDGNSSPILRVVIDPDRAGKHLLSVGTKEVRDNILLDYTGKK